MRVDPGNGGPSTADREELRIALVLNGGVSLAIWMGGACHEVDRLTRREGAYAALLDWVRSDARVDVISGTSAGGINGAAVALSQCNARTQGLGLLRDVWLESGSFAQLLRQPFAGSPPSLLQGDEYFLPQLNRAFRRLAEPFEAVGVNEAPMDLTITATLLTGVPAVSVDHSGQRISQKRHDGLFRFQRGPTHRHGNDEDDFADASVAVPAGGVLDALALAARTTASYPVAFEPSYLPATTEQAGQLADGLHPDMHDHMTGAWDQSVVKHARYAVDGGVLANTPTRPALQAIDTMPAEGLVRRVLLLVHPHAPAPGQDAHDRADDPPTLASLGGSILGALTSEGSRNYVHLIEQHNRMAGSRREMRGEVVQLPVRRDGPDAPAPLGNQARLAFPWYRVLRSRRATRDLADWWLARSRPDADAGEDSAATESWAGTSQSVLALLERAGDAWMPVPSDALPGVDLLGFEGALGVADAAVDYLRRCLWSAACSGGDLDPIKQARGAVSEARNAVLATRKEFVRQVRTWADTAADLDTWVAQTLALYSSAEIRAVLAVQCEAIAAQVAAVHVLPDGDDQSSDARVLRGFSEVLGSGTVDAAEVLERLNQVQVLTYVVSDEVTTGNSLPIDLVQLTYQVSHPFAPFLSGEAKVAGDLLSRFSAFLKRSWRVNDWAWGRLDASRTLCRTVLEPSRVQRCVDASRRRGEPFEGAARRRAEELLAAVPALPGMPSVEQVATELSGLDPALSGPPAPLEHLPAVFAALLACEVAADEMPELVRAVDQDDLEGANRRARGSVAVKANRAVLTAAREGDAAARWTALQAFAQAGVGTETPGSEGSSDQLIATATNAAATGVTLLDSPRAGLGFLSPVTRTLRGAALLPYWTITGLTSGGPLAQGLAVLGLAAGAVLFTLGMLGIGPGWGIAVGAAAVLGGFAYGALRSGTALHSAVLLIPAVTLLAWAAQRPSAEPATGSAESAAEASAAGSASPLGILVSVVLLVGGLALLASLRPPIRSPLAWLHPAEPPAATPGAVPVAGGNRRSRWPQLAFGLGLVVLAGLLLTPAVRSRLATAGATVLEAVAGLPPVVRVVGLVLLLAAAAAVLVLGARLAYDAGVSWRLVVLEAAPSADGASTRYWRTHQVEHPAGTTAGWSWVYGVAALLVAVLVLAWFGFGWPDEPWGRAALIGLALGALLLLLPVPWYVDRSAQRRLHDQLVAVFRRQPVTATMLQKVQAVFAAGLNYQRVLVTPEAPVEAADAFTGVELTPAAARAWVASQQQ
jgi:predicted acylesterase/phospholipase RssA